MILRLFTALFVALSIGVAMAQPNCVEESRCQSQLLRVEVSNTILRNNAGALLPALKAFSESPTLSSLLERKYPLQGFAFPQNSESCEREKKSNPLFEKIDCQENGLCGKKDLNPKVREAICFKLPCPLFEGTLHAGKCGSALDIYPDQISFPEPIDLKKIKLTPTKVEFHGNEANLCFRINELSVSLGVRLGLDTRGTSLPDNGITIGNVSPVLDGPRDICMTATVNIGADKPVSNLVLIPQGNTPFISDNMIRTAAKNLEISGLSGYPAGQLDKIKAEIVPVIVQPLRDTVESAVKDSLGSVFEQEINRLAGEASGTSSHLVSSQNLSSELGIGNLQIRNQLAITECAAIKGAHQSIPPTHPCVGLPFYNETITPDNFGSPLINELMELKRLSDTMNITSESEKQRLIALKGLIRNQVDEFARPDDPPHFIQGYKDGLESMIKEYVDPLIDKISKNQLESQIFNFVEIQNQLQGGASRNVGVSVPDICSDTRPSPHARREMKNCPVQAYVDLREMNQVLDKLWNAGRICQQGKGPFVPKMVNGYQEYDPEGKPLASGCYMEVGGMGCYLSNAPHIDYDSRTKKYKTSVKLKACYRGPVMFGIGKLGGDFNIDFLFQPKACNGGDFCMDNPTVNWKVVPGSERFALKPNSFLNNFVNEKIQSTINSALSDTIRLPLTSGVGPLAAVPLEAEGRVDTGPGFFGACLKLRTGGVSGQ
jgi:hypothetical protein